MLDRTNRVLIVDDDLAWANSLKAFFDSSDARVTLAPSLPEALRALAEGTFDVVIADLVLSGPGLDGMELLQEVRRSHPGTRAIVVSGHVTPPLELFRFGIPFINKRALSRKAVEEAIAQAEGLLSLAAAGVASSLSLDQIRLAFSQEAKRILEIKACTLSIAGEGDFDLPKALEGFKRDIERQLVRFPFNRNVFLMMKFRPGNRDVANYIIENLAARGFNGARADDHAWNLTDNVYNPIAVLHCCKYGIALFDEPETSQSYSANVAYELGMMHQQNKRCLILKHASLPSVPFDLIKDLYVEYERDLVLRQKVERWLDQLPLTSG